MKQAVNNRWIYAHLGTVRWIRKRHKMYWLFYPSIYMLVIFMLLSLDAANKAQARILRNKGGEIEQDSGR